MFLLLLPAVNGNASIGTLRTAEWTGLGGDKNLVRELVDGDAVRVGASRHVDEPLARSGINHAHDWSVGHVASRGVVAVVAGVVPDFVSTAALIDLDLAGEAGCAGRAGTVKHNQQGRELDAIMASAPDQKIVARTLDDASRHAVEGWDNVDNHRASRISNSRIDFVNAPDGDARLSGQSGNRTIQVLHVKSAMQ